MSERVGGERALPALGTRVLAALLPGDAHLVTLHANHLGAESTGDLSAQAVRRLLTRTNRFLALPKCH